MNKYELAVSRFANDLSIGAITHKENDMSFDGVTFKPDKKKFEEDAELLDKLEYLLRHGLARIYVENEETINVSLDEGAKLPQRAHAADAGLDLFSRDDDATIEAGGSHCFDTGVHIEIPIGCVGFLKSKSGLNVFHDITSDGTIDAGYTGSIVVKLYNHGKEAYTVHKGDKISQLVIQPIRTPSPVLVGSVSGGDRGDNGFGSSGK